MERVFESLNECPLVEQLIWKTVAKDFGDFAGVKELSFADLLALRAAIDHQVQAMYVAAKG